MVAQPTGFGSGATISNAPTQRTKAQELQSAGFGLGFLGQGIRNISEAAKTQQFLSAVGPAAQRLQSTFNIDPEIALLLASEGLKNFQGFQKGSTESIIRQGAGDFASGQGGDVLSGGLDASGGGIAGSRQVNEEGVSPLPLNIQQQQEASEFSGVRNPFLPTQEATQEIDARQQIAALPQDLVGEAGGIQQVAEAASATPFTPQDQIAQESFGDALATEGQNTQRGKASVFLPPERTNEENIFIGLNFDKLTQGKQNLDAGTKAIIEAGISRGKAPAEITKEIQDATKVALENNITQQFGSKQAQADIDLKSAQAFKARQSGLKDQRDANATGEIKPNEIKSTTEQFVNNVPGFNALNPREQDLIIRRYLEALQLNPEERDRELKGLFNNLSTIIKSRAAAQGQGTPGSGAALPSFNNIPSLSGAQGNLQ